jgi:hypothetical protein
MKMWSWGNHRLQASNAHHTPQGSLSFPLPPPSLFKTMALGGGCPSPDPLKSTGPQHLFPVPWDPSVAGSNALYAGLQDFLLWPVS